MKGGFEYEPVSMGPSTRVQSLLDGLDWTRMRAEVEREHQARIVVAGACGYDKWMLLNVLRGWPVPQTPGKVDDATPPPQDMGLFTLIDLPPDGPLPVDGAPVSKVAYVEGVDKEDDLIPIPPPSPIQQPGHLSLMLQADMIVFVLDAGNLARQTVLAPAPVEYHWLCRIRALGRPLVVVLSKADLLGDAREAGRVELERTLGMPVLTLSAQDGPEVAGSLVAGMLEACPKLAVPLGREVPQVRRYAALRLIHEAAMRATLLGAEPVPLLDIAFLCVSQTRLLLRLAALYSKLGVSFSNRALVVSLAGGVIVRLLTQQAAKLVPLVGWAISGLLSGAITWLVGWATMTAFDGGWSGLHALAIRPRLSCGMKGRFGGLRSRLGAVWGKVQHVR